MGKFKWHASAVKNIYHKPRHYNHIKQLYRFILRYPGMFKKTGVSIFDHDKLIIQLSFEEVQQRLSLGLTEVEERKYIRKRGREENEQTGVIRECQ